MKKIVLILHLVVLSSCAPREYMRLTTVREREMLADAVSSTQLQYRLSHDITLVRDTVIQKFGVNDKGKLRVLPTDSVEKIFFSTDSLCVKNGNKAVFKDRDLPLGTYRVGSDSFIVIKLRDGQFYTIDGKRYRVFIGDAIRSKKNHGKVPYLLYEKIYEPTHVKTFERVKGKTVY